MKTIGFVLGIAALTGCTTTTGGLEARINELKRVQQEEQRRLAAVRSDIEKARKEERQARRRADWMLCRARVARMEAEVVAEVAQCAKQVARYHTCKADGSKRTAMGGIGGCILGTLLTAASSGAAAPIMVTACGGGAAVGHLTKKTCSKPACEESISTIERRLLQREKLTAWPKCSGYIGARAIEQVKVIPKGVLISGVDPNYSAARIGIKKGDIIVRIGGQDVGSRKRLSGEIARRSFGDAIELQLYRQGRLLRMKGTIGTKAGRPYFGIYMKELPKGFIVPAGVVVAPVPDGAAKAAGLPTGARVVSIGGRPVFRLAKYREVLKKQFGKVVEIVAVSKTGEFRTYSVPVGPVAR